MIRVWIDLYGHIPSLGRGWGRKMITYFKKYVILLYKLVLGRVKVKGAGSGGVAVDNGLHEASRRILKTQTATTDHWKCCGLAHSLTHADLPQSHARPGRSVF